MAEGLDIRYQHVVERIEWGGGGATVHCSGGRSFECDAVICTVSLGVLKVRPEVETNHLCCADLLIADRHRVGHMGVIEGEDTKSGGG